MKTRAAAHPAQGDPEQVVDGGPVPNTVSEYLAGTGTVLFPDDKIIREIIQHPGGKSLPFIFATPQVSET